MRLLWLLIDDSRRSSSSKVFNSSLSHVIANHMIIRSTLSKVLIIILLLFKITFLLICNRVEISFSRQTIINVMTSTNLRLNARFRSLMSCWTYRRFLTVHCCCRHSFVIALLIVTISSSKIFEIVNHVLTLSHYLRIQS